MARPGISYLDVAKTATKLIEQEIRPSIEEVRKALGTGSNSTINRHLRDWRAKQGNQIELEKGLPDSLLIAIRGIYDAITEQATEKVNILQKEHKESSIILQSEIDQSKKQCLIISQENNASKNAISTLKAAKEVLQAVVNDVNQKLSNVTSDNILLHEKLKSKKSEIHTLNQQLKNNQKNIEHYREITLQQWEREKNKYETKISSLEKILLQKEELNANVLELTIQNNIISKNKKTIESELQIEREKCYTSAVMLRENQINYQSLESEFESIKIKHDDLSKALDDNNIKLHEFQLEVEKYKERVLSLDKYLKITEGKNLKLNDEIMFLIKDKTMLALQLEQIQKSTCR